MMNWWDPFDQSGGGGAGDRFSAQFSGWELDPYAGMPEQMRQAVAEHDRLVAQAAATSRAAAAVRQALAHGDTSRAAEILKHNPEVGIADGQQQFFGAAAAQAVADRQPALPAEHESGHVQWVEAALAARYADRQTATPAADPATTASQVARFSARLMRDHLVSHRFGAEQATPEPDSINSIIQTVDVERFAPQEAAGAPRASFASGASFPHRAPGPGGPDGPLPDLTPDGIEILRVETRIKGEESGPAQLSPLRQALYSVDPRLSRVHGYRLDLTYTAPPRTFDEIELGVMQVIGQMQGVSGVTAADVKALKSEYEAATMGQYIGLTGSVEELQAKMQATGGKLPVAVSDYQLAVIGAGLRSVVERRQRHAAWVAEQVERAQAEGTTRLADVGRIYYNLAADQVNAPLALIQRMAAARGPVGLQQLPEPELVGRATYRSEMFGDGDGERVEAGVNLSLAAISLGQAVKSVAVEGFGPTVEGVTGAGTTPVSWAARQAYKEIRTRTAEQVASELEGIVRHTKVGELAGVSDEVYRETLEAVRNHLFMEVHEVPVAPNRYQWQRFTPSEDIADLWNGAANGTLNPDQVKEFQRLVAHEYVEHSLMRAGMRYRPAHPDVMYLDPVKREWSFKFSSEYYGAHDLAPVANPKSKPYSHWPSYGILVKPEAR